VQSKEIASKPAPKTQSTVEIAAFILNPVKKIRGVALVWELTSPSWAILQTENYLTWGECIVAGMDRQNERMGRKEW